MRSIQERIDKARGGGIQFSYVSSDAISEQHQIELDQRLADFKILQARGFIHRRIRAEEIIKNNPGKVLGAFDCLFKPHANVLECIHEERKRTRGASFIHPVLEEDQERLGQALRQLVKSRKRNLPGRRNL